MIDEGNSPIMIGIYGINRFGREKMCRLKADREVDMNFIIFDQRAEGQKEFQSILSTDNFTSCEKEFFNSATDGIILSDFMDFSLNKYQAGLKKIPSIFCSVEFLSNLKGLEVLFEIAKSKNSLVCFDFPFRYTRGFMKINDKIKKGRLGKIHQIDLVYYKHRKKEGQLSSRCRTNFYGCFMETGIHLLDFALKTLNYPKIKSLQAIPYKNGKKLENQSPLYEDYFLITIITEKGTLINLRCSRTLPASRNKVIEMDFHGEKGDIFLCNNNEEQDDIIAQQYKDQNMEIISSPPDSYQDVALREWIWQTKAKKTYNTKIEKEILKLAEIVDKIYNNRNFNLQ